MEFHGIVAELGEGISDGIRSENRIGLQVFPWHFAAREHFSALLLARRDGIETSVCYTALA